jgi:hypothetical protein
VPRVLEGSRLQPSIINIVTADVASPICNFFEEVGPSFSTVLQARFRSSPVARSDAIKDDGGGGLPTSMCAASGVAEPRTVCEER